MKGYDLIECDKGLTYCCSKCCFKCKNPTTTEIWWNSDNTSYQAELAPCLSPIDGGVSGYFKEVTA